MKNVLNKQKVFLISSCLVSVLVLYLFANNDKPKCPDDFTNSDEKIAAFDAWVTDFYNKNPDASIEDMAQARLDHNVKNGCTKAIQRYNDYVNDNVDPETKAKIENVVNEYFPDGISQ